MPGSPMMEAPAAQTGAALVSVDGRTYPLRSARIDAEASGGLVRSTLVQTYRNPYAESLEVVYTMPLPADGAVIGYTMRLGERVIRGEVHPRAKARKDYEKALFEGRSAALLEQERDDTFTQRLGALPAGADAEITIEVLHPLGFIAGSQASDAQWEYRFPTVVGVRYEGAAGRVPDADKLDVDRGSAGEIPTRIELKLDIIDGDGAKLHRLESMPLDRDLVVRWPGGRPEVGAQLVLGPGLPGDDGRYGLITIAPPAVPHVSFSRDLTILIDASGSMMGEPIEWAKEVAKGLLAGLNPPDMFEVIAFADRPKALTGGVVAATFDAITAAITHVEAIRASGGTEMVEGMMAALRPLRAESQRQVVLITDGQIGFEDEVVRRVRDGLPSGSRLHVVGIGAAPNRTLTARAARAGRGIECFVCGHAQVDTATRSLTAATARPVLTDLRIESAVVRGLAPARPPDVMAGRPAVVAVELANEGGRIDLSGMLAGASQRWTWSIDVPSVEQDAAAIAVMSVPVGARYGRELIADLEVSAHAATDRIEQVALRHRIASRMTSLVAIADEPSVDPRHPRRRIELPVEVPAYQSAEALGLHASYRTMGRQFATLRMPDVDGAAMISEEHEFGRAEDDTARPGDVSRWARILRSSGVARFRSLMFGRRTQLVRGRIVALEGELLVIEYETPEDQFFAPSAESVILIAENPVDTAAIDRSLSSPGGWHGKGLLLRLALRRTAGWTIGEELTVEWGGEARLSIVVAEP